ncbi:MAG: 30S ribosomal protein S21 [Bacteroidia bacterium]|nr:30S ribosomal protein S21 [Bacteroidia bacterium]
MATQKVRVEVRNGDINRALKLYKSKTIESGHLQELRDRKEYTKPTTVRRRKKQQAIRRNQYRLDNDETGLY